MEGSSSSSSSYFSYPTSSSCSFASELFGSNESPSSSTGIFGSIFAPSSKVLGWESVRPEVIDKKPDSSNEVWNNKTVTPGDASRSGEGESQSMQNKDMNSIYQDQRVQPCHLSSSIYYGGQDIYSLPQRNPGSGLNPPIKKNGGEDDDSRSASRGNWWQGSLYY